MEFVNCLPFRKVRLASSLYVDFTVVHSETFPPPRQQGSFWESQELNLGLFFNYCRSRCVWWSQPLTGSWTWVSFLCRSRCVCWSLPLTGSGSTTARWSAPPAPPSAQTAPRRAGSSRWANTNNLLTQALKRSAPPAPPSAQTAPRKAGSSRWANTNNLLTQALKRSAPPAPPSAQTMLQGRPGAQGEQTQIISWHIPFNWDSSTRFLPLLFHDSTPSGGVPFFTCLSIFSYGLEFAEIFMILLIYCNSNGLKIHGIQ